MFITLVLGLSTPSKAENHVLPEVIENIDEISRSWSVEDDWLTSPIRQFPTGSRLGVILEGSPNAEPEVQVRTIDNNNELTPWHNATETWKNSEFHVLISELPASTEKAQIRISTLDELESVAWEVREPVYETTRAPNAPPPPSNSSLSSALINFGVIPRTTWGARSTTCTTPESNWYRNAVHHTASNQSYGGSVLGNVQLLQSYAMDSGTWCDVPYQFLVGYDGSVWEGRELIYRSGATGGYDNGIQNNVGNIAVSFMGCYDPSACTVGPHYPAPLMIGWARALIQLLGSEHTYTIDTTTVLGHQEWPGNSTACPGSDIMDRMDLIRSPSAAFQGEVVSTSYTNNTVTAAPNEIVSVWVDVQNTGFYEWRSSSTNIAVLPRDTTSALETSDWISQHRTATVNGTIPSGSVARFSFTLQAPATGSSVVSLEMVQEFYTWFSDTPVGGGPVPSDISFVLEVIQSNEPSSEPSLEPSSEPSTEPSSDPECLDREDGIWCLNDSILGGCINGQFSETSCIDFGKICSVNIDRCIDIQCFEREDESWCYEGNPNTCVEGNWNETTCDDEELCDVSGYCIPLWNTDSAEMENGNTAKDEKGCHSSHQPKHGLMFILISMVSLILRRRQTQKNRI